MGGGGAILAAKRLANMGKRACVKPVHKNNSRHHNAIEFKRVEPSNFSTFKNIFFKKYDLVPDLDPS